MTFIPSFRLYQTNGTSLVYTFPIVQSTNAPQSVKKSFAVEAMRGNGGIIIPGSDSMWDLTMRFILAVNKPDYTALTAKIAALEAAIPLFTPFVLQFDQSISSTYDYNVKRVEPISYPESMRTTIQEVNIKFKVNSW